MTESVYLAINEVASGKRVVALGLMELAARHFERVAFFRPVVRGRAEDDLSIQLIRDRYPTAASAAAMAGVDRAEARRLLGDDRTDELLKIILQRYKQLEEQADFVLCEGTSFRGLAPGHEFQLNAEIAENLGCAVLPVFSAHEKSPSDVLSAVRIGLEQLGDHGCAVVAACVNQTPLDQFDAIRAACRELSAPGAPPIYVLPHEPLLAQPTLREIQQALGAERLQGDPAALDREVARVTVAAMQLPHFLERIGSESLVITPGDRDDILLGSVAATLSRNGPSAVGVVLTGGLRPAESVLQLIAGMPAVPILSVSSDTFPTAMAVSRVRAHLGPGTPRKIASALGLFEQYVDLEELGARLRTPPARHTTPLLFEYELIRRARSARQRIVLAEGEEPRILAAADNLRRRDVVDLVLLGSEERVRSQAAALGYSLERIDIIDPQSSPDRETYAACYHELRRHKGITLDAARDRMLDVNYFGTMMVHRGQAGGLVSGAAHTTADTIRPAFEFIKTAPGVDVVSSVFLMCLPDRVLVYGDCAVIPNPTAEQLAEIALSSAETAAQFEIEPRVAMLSYSTGESGAGEDVERVRQATRIAQQRRPDLLIDGPMQYDAAIDPRVARSKLPASPVAGRATVFIFPDLNTGNNTYKAVQRSAGAVAIGPILQGLRKPVNDLSRGCTVTDIINTVAITAIQAQQRGD